MMIFLFDKRKIMGVLIKQYLDGFRKGDDGKSKYPKIVMRVETVSKKSNIDIDKTFLIIRELVLRGYVKWYDTNSYYTVWTCGVTPQGYFEFKEGWKRYFKELLIALGASAPFVTILVYFLEL